MTRHAEDFLDMPVPRSTKASASHSCHVAQAAAHCRRFRDSTWSRCKKAPIQTEPLQQGSQGLVRLSSDANPLWWWWCRGVLLACACHPSRLGHIWKADCEISMPSITQLTAPTEECSRKTVFLSIRVRFITPVCTCEAIGRAYRAMPKRSRMDVGTPRDGIVYKLRRRC